MRVLFGFSNAQLLESFMRNPLADRIGNILLGKKHMQPRKLCVVGRHRREVKGHLLHVLHIALREHRGELLGAVIAEIQEHNGIMRPDAADRAARIVNQTDGLDELIGHAFGIGLLNGLPHVAHRLALALAQKRIGLVNALPALVSVHCIIAADHACNRARKLAFLHARKHMPNKPRSASGIGVAAVHEGMHIGLLNAFLLGKFQKALQVLERGMHAAVGKQAHEVQRRSALLDIVKERPHFLVLIKRFGLARRRSAGSVDLDQVLVHHAARADVEVPDFGVSHLPLGQTNIFPVGSKQRMRPLLLKRRKIRWANRRNHITLGAVSAAPAVENH